MLATTLVADDECVPGTGCAVAVAVVVLCCAVLCCGAAAVMPAQSSQPGARFSSNAGIRVARVLEPGACCRSA